MKCETCQNEASIHVVAIDCHFCKRCLHRIDIRIGEINHRAAMVAELEKCEECGGDHEPSMDRAVCIRYWKLRAVRAEGNRLTPP